MNFENVKLELFDPRNFSVVTATLNEISVEVRFTRISINWVNEINEEKISGFKFNGVETPLNLFKTMFKQMTTQEVDFTPIVETVKEHATNMKKAADEALKVKAANFYKTCYVITTVVPALEAAGITIVNKENVTPEKLAELLKYESDLKNPSLVVSYENIKSTVCYEEKTKKLFVKHYEDYGTKGHGYQKLSSVVDKIIQISNEKRSEILREKQTKTEEQKAFEKITKLVKEVAPVYNVKQTTDGGYRHDGRYHSSGTIYIVYSKSEYDELMAVRTYGEFLKIKGIGLKLTEASFQKILSDLISIQNS